MNLPVKIDPLDPESPYWIASDMPQKDDSKLAYITFICGVVIGAVLALSCASLLDINGKIDWQAKPEKAITKQALPD